jgi:hypothetical protein
MIEPPHVFISYSHSDRDFARRIAADLAGWGVRVWWDQWALRVGDSISRKIEEGITGAGWLVVVLSPDSVASAWVQRELSAALMKELDRRDVFVLPLLHRDCEIPLLLRDKLYADFRTSYADGLAAVRERIATGIDLQIADELLSENASRISMAYLRIPIPQQTEYREWLERQFRSKDEAHRMAALMALCELHADDAGVYLRQGTKDLSDAVRRLSVHYIGKLRLRNDRSLVAALMSDGSPMVRAAAREAYVRLGGQP